MTWQQIARQAARRHGVSRPELFVRQMGLEAGGKDLRSSAGAEGPAQIMPATARAWGVKNVHDIYQAYDAAAAHMAAYERKFGSFEKALWAYNAGEGALVKGHMPEETQIYIKKIMGGLKLPGGGASYGIKHSTVSTPGRTTQDVQGAILSVLMSGTKPGSVGKEVLNKLAYAPPYQPTKTPGKTYNIASPQKTVSPPRGDGVVLFDGVPVAGWIAAELRYARAHGWTGKVVSGVRSNAAQAKLYAEYKSGKRAGPVAKPGTSNHEGIEFPRGAVDVSEPQQLSAILKKRGSPLQWAGAKDLPHFSHPHGGGY